MTFKKRILLSFVMCCFNVFIHSQNTAENYIKIIETSSEKQEQFNALDSLLFSLNWEEDIEKYANFSEMYVNLAIEKKHYKEAIQAATEAFGIINRQLGQPERALELILKVETYTDKVEDQYYVGNVYLKKGGGYFNGKDFSKAIENYTKAIETFTDKDSIYKADAIFFRGQANFSSGHFLQAIKDYALASNYYEKLGDQQYMFYTQSSIINAYGASGFHEKTIEERQKLIDKKLELQYSDGLSVDYYNQSINYGKLDSIDAQENSLLKALNYIGDDKIHRNSDGEYVIINAGLAEFYIEQGALSKAKLYLDKASIRNQKFEETTQYELSYNITKSKYLFHKGDINQAELIANKVLSASKQWGNPSLTVKVLDFLHMINLEKRNYKQALIFFKDKSKINDSILNKEKSNAFSYYQTLYEIERKEKEITKQHSDIKILEHDKALEQIKTRTLIILLIALISITIIIVYILKQRASQLKEKLEFNKKELNSYTLQLLKKRREHDILEEELGVLKNEKVADDKLDKLQDLVSSKILTSEDWKEFKNKFEKVYPNFLVKARLNNNLTNAEERLLTLEKLNLKNSEIADVLGVSSDSVIKNRYRLRKKLGISKEVPITEIAEN